MECTSSTINDVIAIASRKRRWPRWYDRCWETSAATALDDELDFEDFTSLKKEEHDYWCYFVCATAI